MNTLINRYVLSLVIDSMRSVRSFHLEKAAASVLTTCVGIFCRISLPLKLLYHTSNCKNFL